MKTFNENTLNLPSFNLHGSNIESLQADYVAAMSATRTAIEKAFQIDFNARDYQDMEDFNGAKADRMEALRKLQEAYTYFETIAEHLSI